MLLNCGAEEDSWESLDCKEIKPVNLKGNQPWKFTGRTDAEAPILWPPDAKSQLIGKVPDGGKDWGQEEKVVAEDEMVGWHHQLDGHEFEQTLGDGEGRGNLACCSPWGGRVGHDWATEQQPIGVFWADRSGVICYMSIKLKRQAEWIQVVAVETPLLTRTPSPYRHLSISGPASPDSWLLSSAAQCESTLPWKWGEGPELEVRGHGICCFLLWNRLVAFEQVAFLWGWSRGSIICEWIRGHLTSQRLTDSAEVCDRSHPSSQGGCWLCAWAPGAKGLAAAFTCAGRVLSISQLCPRCSESFKTASENMPKSGETTNSLWEHA